MLFFNGVTLVLQSINGAYIGRIYEETKNRPLFIVRDTIGIEEE
jgi:dolichol-phosphate mannosyltransferase